MTTAGRPANPHRPVNAGDDDVDTTFGNEACHLTNGDVKLALLGHYDTKHRLVTFLAAEDLLGRQSRPFGFDLAPIVRIRKAISTIGELPPTPGRGARQPVLDRFRQELIFTTAAAARESSLDLAMQLYLALMALHDREAETDAYLPDDAISAAGEYLMRCLAVQASYSQFKTYRPLLLQFLKVVHTIKVPCRDENMRIEQRFIKANTTSREELQKGLIDFERIRSAARVENLDPVPVDTFLVAGHDKTGPVLSMRASRFDQTPHERWRLLLLAGASDDEAEPIARGAGVDLGKGATVVRLVDGSTPGWAPSPQGLRLILPTKGGPSADRIVRTWCARRGGPPGAQAAPLTDPSASLGVASGQVRWNLLDIFEELLDMTENPTEVASQAVGEWPVQRKQNYARLDEALRRVLAAAAPTLA